MNKVMVKIGMVIGLLIISTAVSANAQATKRYRADIKFDFSIGAKTYEAGKYDIRVMDSGILMIEDMNARKLLVALTSPESKREDTVLIFQLGFCESKNC